MQVEIIQNGKVLNTYQHAGKRYVEVPALGPYQIRLGNHSFKRRMAVISVDGINVVDGEDAAIDGQGYVLEAFQTITIKGWRRTDSEVAEFIFGSDGTSYAQGTGRGVRNTASIGIAVFDEKEKPFVINWPIYIRRPDPWRPYEPWYPTSPWYGEVQSTPVHNTLYASNSGGGGGGTFSCGNTLGLESESATVNSVQCSNAIPTPDMDMGTGYGERATMHTMTTTFEKASDTPATVLTFQYGTRDKLKSWGVPVSKPVRMEPNPFPASSRVACKPPTGWTG